MLGIEYKNNSNRSTISVNDCFEVLTSDERITLREGSSFLEFEKGETIIKQGFVANNIMLIDRGVVKLDVTDDHKTTTVKLLSDGQFIGIICSFAHKNLSFSAEALENTRVEIIEMSTFQHLIQSNGSFALLLIQHMSAMTSGLVHWMARLNSKHVEGALAIMLLEFCKIYKSYKFELPITRVGLAKMLGYSKESLIKTLSKFNKDEILSINDKEIEVLDLKRLGNIAEKG
ncbi:MAG: Crp/Fnr family transcriptional regulator [Bacteroidales bacterium]